VDTQEAVAKLAQYKELLSRHLSFDKMILFGSHARGTQREESAGDYFSSRPLLWRLRREVDDRIEPVLLETRHDQSSFLQAILKTGIII
jgi:uncharacterized protein